MKRFALALIAAALLAVSTMAYSATATQTFALPAGTVSFTDRDGNVYTPDSNGYITLPANYVIDGFRAGFTHVDYYGSAGTVTCTKGTMYNTPVAHTGHGSVFACISTNKGVTVGNF